jgi:hypothetical protein
MNRRTEPFGLAWWFSGGVSKAALLVWPRTSPRPPRPARPEGRYARVLPRSYRGSQHQLVAVRQPRWTVFEVVDDALQHQLRRRERRSVVQRQDELIPAPACQPIALSDVAPDDVRDVPQAGVLDKPFAGSWIDDPRDRPRAKKPACTACVVRDLLTRRVSTRRASVT